jgi:type VI secretion system secreted protein Hcp
MKWSHNLFALASAGSLLVFADPAIAAVDAYLQIDGINGESTTKPGWIEVSSFQWGASRGLSSPTGGSADRESSAPSVSEITITKTVDKASPLLAMSATSGKHYGSVMLQVRKAGGQPINYVLSDVTISKYGHSGGGDRPQESLSLNFTKITMRSDGASGASGGAMMGAALPPAGQNGRSSTGVGLPPPGPSRSSAP